MNNIKSVVFWWVIIVFFFCGNILRWFELFILWCLDLGKEFIGREGGKKFIGFFLRVKFDEWF